VFNIRTPQTFTKHLLKRFRDRDALKRAGGEIHYDPAASFRSAVPEPMEVLSRFEPHIHYPSIPDEYELPTQEPWFDSLDASDVSQAPGLQMEALVPIFEEGGFIRSEPGFLAADSLPLESPSGVLEVMQAVEQVQSGEQYPAALTDEQHLEEQPQGLERQVEQPLGYEYAGGGLEQAITQAPEPFDPMAPGQPF
jgi:hypothetical protein